MAHFSGLNVVVRSLLTWIVVEAASLLSLAILISSSFVLLMAEGNFEADGARTVSDFFRSGCDRSSVGTGSREEVIEIATLVAAIW